MNEPEHRFIVRLRCYADQSDLLQFVKRMQNPPKEIRIIHGDNEAKRVLQKKLTQLYPTTNILIP